MERKNVMTVRDDEYNDRYSKMKSKRLSRKEDSITFEEINDAIKTLKIDKAIGVDGLADYVLKS